MTAERDLTLVLDVGKTRAKLLLIDAAGQALAQTDCDNQSTEAPQGYTALGVGRLQAWCVQAVQAWAPDLRARVARLITSTHGAAFCGLGAQADAQWRDGGLALPPMDYEWDGHAALRAAERHELDDFASTG